MQKYRDLFLNKQKLHVMFSIKFFVYGFKINVC